jgi:hypothetical protein
MYCGICSAYLAFSRGIPRKRGKITHCSGCRPRNKQCAYIKGQCELLRKGEVTFCYECPRFPCPRLLHIDMRYQTRYGMSFVQNLKDIEKYGAAALLRRLKKRFACPKCGGPLSIHNGKCFACDTIESWK